MNRDDFYEKYGTKSVGVILIPAALMKLCGKKIITIQEAVVFSFLVDKQEESKKEWFGCTQKEMEAKTYLQNRDQSRTISKLKKKGMIDTKREGLPAKRYFRLKWETVENIQRIFNQKKTKGVINKKQFWSRCSKTVGPDGQPPYSVLYKYNTSSIESDKTKTSKGFIQLKNNTPITISNDDENFAKKLSISLQENRKLIKGFSIKSWSKEFSKLRSVDNIPIERISNVLSWYTRHIGEAFIPQAYSAKSFRSKFSKLEEHYHRKKEILISQKVKNLSSEIKSQYPWSNKIKIEDIEEACQVCFDSYVLFFKDLENISINKETYPKSKKSQRIDLREFTTRIINRTPNASNFTRYWLDGISKSLTTWKNFNGNVRSLAWDYDLSNFKFDYFIGNYFDNDKDHERWKILKRIVNENRKSQ